MPLESEKRPVVLICDDDRSLSEILETTLKYDGYDTVTVRTGQQALKQIDKADIDVILLELKLPEMNGLHTLKQIQKRYGQIPVIMISGLGDIQAAIEATRCGAFDFLEKPLDTERVLVTIRNALEKRRLELEKLNLLQKVADQYRMIGTSQIWKKIQVLIQKAARTNIKVLIEGENGTGKELIARAIHHQSQRAFGPFIAVNCAAIPENLIESELFGHKKGSFTGAYSDKPGRFQNADGGTILLDEIGDMSLMTQAKVLRTLEQGSVEMIGSNDSIPVNVRVIAATNKNLINEMETGKFREDLYFRLNVLNIKVPPLRAHPEDIPLLVEYFIELFCHEHSIRLKTITRKAFDRLMAYSWPGNIRELKNLTEKLVILNESDEIDAKNISKFLNENLKQNRYIPANLPFKIAKEQFEIQYLADALKHCQWNITKTAELLSIPRTYLHKKINKLNLKREG
jgi:two-component system nitrogen regulation response regulator NtrX